MRKWIVAIALVLLANEANEVYAQMRLRQLMANKLQASQNLLAAIAMAASIIPARRASRIDPTIALREE